ARSHSQSLSQTRPWEAENMSRRTWYRRRTGTVGTDSSAILLSPPSHTFSVPGERETEGRRPQAVAPRATQSVEGKQSSQTATKIAADRFESLPVELRLLALGLPLENQFSRAAA